MINLSIIIPVYNTPKVLLSKCLSSVKMNVQELEDNVEVLLINDGSTEPYIEKILKEAEQEDSHFSYLYKQNGGVSETRNYGIFKAKFEYIAFVDSDDYLESGAIAYMMQVVEKNKADLTIFGICRDQVDGAYNHFMKMVTPEEKKKILEGIMSEINEKYYQSLGFSLFTSCGRIYKKDILRQNQIEFDANIKYSEDSFFNFCYITVVDKIFMDNKQIYHYVNNQESASVTFTFKKGLNLPILLNTWEQFLLEHYPNQKEMLDLLSTRALEEIRGIRYQYFTHPQNTKSFRALISELNVFLRTPPIDKWVSALRISYAKDIVSLKNIILLKLHLYWIYLLIERKRRKKHDKMQ